MGNPSICGANVSVPFNVTLAIGVAEGFRVSPGDDDGDDAAASMTVVDASEALLFSLVCVERAAAELWEADGLEEAAANGAALEEAAAAEELGMGGEEIAADVSKAAAS